MLEARTIKTTDRIGNISPQDIVILDSHWRRKQALESAAKDLADLKERLSNAHKTQPRNWNYIRKIKEKIAILEEMLEREAERDYMNARKSREMYIKMGINTDANAASEEKNKQFLAEVEVSEALIRQNAEIEHMRRTMHPKAFEAYMERLHKKEEAELLIAQAERRMCANVLQKVK